MKRPYYNQEQREIYRNFPETLIAKQTELGLAILHTKRDIGEALPDWVYDISRVVRKYGVTALVFYALAIHLIYIGEYPSAIITAIIGIYFAR